MKSGPCAAFAGAYNADVTLFPNAPLALCDLSGIEPGKKCLYKDQHAAVNIQEVECADYECCLEVVVLYSEWGFPVTFTNRCNDVTTNGPNTMAECDVEFFGNLGSGKDYYKLVGGGDNLVVTSKTGNEPDSAALGLIHGTRVP